MSLCQKKYIGLIVSLALSSSSLLAHATTFVVMGDPQAWRLNSGDPNSESNKSPWEIHNMHVAKSLVQLKKEEGIQFGIINGDITEFGRPASFNSFDVVYKSNLTFPVYIGLGNHDYANNINDCAGGGYPASYNYCAMYMAQQLQYEVSQYKKNNPSAGFSIDKQGNDAKRGSGSLAYSWNEGNLHFIQLNNYPTYTAHLDQWAGAWDLRITKSLDWLEKDLASAAARGKDIIVNLHDANDHFVSASTAEEKQRFREMLKKYGVSAVFAAHRHFAYQDTGRKDMFGDVPVFISDALFRGGYYLVKTDSTGMNIDKYRGESGSPRYDGTMGYVKFIKREKKAPVRNNGSFTIISNSR